jgi:hypothetical protein
LAAIDIRKEAKSAAMKSDIERMNRVFLCFLMAMAAA